MKNTARQLFDDITNKCMPNKFMPEAGTVTELVKTKEEKVEFSMDWDTKVTVLFRPQTVGVKVKFKDSDDANISKSFQLEEENLLKKIFSLLVNKCK